MSKQLRNEDQVSALHVFKHRRHLHSSILITLHNSAVRAKMVKHFEDLGSYMCSCTSAEKLFFSVKPTNNHDKAASSLRCITSSSKWHHLFCLNNFQNIWPAFQFLASKLWGTCCAVGNIMPATVRCRGCPHLENNYDLCDGYCAKWRLFWSDLAAVAASFRVVIFEFWIARSSMGRLPATHPLQCISSSDASILFVSVCAPRSCVMTPEIDVNLFTVSKAFNVFSV